MAKVLNPVWWNSLDKAEEVLANGVQELAVASPDKFTDYVKAYSTGRSVERNGVLGQFSPGDLSKDFAAVFTLKAGEIAPLISTNAGYHIIKVDNVTQGESEAWKAAMNQCREMISMQESQRLVNSWLNDLLEKNYVSILVNHQLKKE
jgi:peptidyl-prolyl cis-trans isomerase C